MRPRRVTAPYVACKPVRPQKDAGMRMLPPVSEPMRTQRDSPRRPRHAAGAAARDALGLCGLFRARNTSFRRSSPGDTSCCPCRSEPNFAPQRVRPPRRKS
jgi:hypothetical protein